MSGNQKKRQPINRTTDNKFVIPTNYKVVIILAACVVICLSFYFIKAQREIEIRDKGYKMNMLRQEIRKVSNMNSNLRSNLAEMKQLKRIMKGLKDYGIQLDVPPIEKVYRIKLPDGVEGLGTIKK